MAQLYNFHECITNICFGKGMRCCLKTLQRVKYVASALSELKSDFIQPKFQTKVQCLFFCTPNFLAVIILQPEIVKLNVTKRYILLDVVGVLTVA